APNVNLVDVRVLDENGAGTVSTVLAGIEWVIANKQRYNIRVINLSLGGGVTQSYKTDPLCQAVERAVQAGIVVVCAAGNYGKDDQGRPLYGSIVSPANDPYVITVGAVNTKQTNTRSDDVMATYSSHGPTLVDGLIKPDLVAPGNKIVSLRATTMPGNTNMLDAQNALVSPDLSKNGIEKDYMTMSGTSMAAPMVSGVVALMLQHNPALTPRMVKAMLRFTAQPMTSLSSLPAYLQLVTEGAGEMNADGAVKLAHALRKDALLAKPGENLLPPGVTLKRLALTSQIAGEKVPFNRDIIYSDGILFAEGILF